MQMDSSDRDERPDLTAWRRRRMFDRQTKRVPGAKTYQRKAKHAPRQDQA